MIRIAICDDEQNIRNYLITLLKKPDMEFDIDIAEYASAEGYISDDKEYDILFLDIELNGKDNKKNGMELARVIRKGNKKQPVIIFVTGYEKYVYDAFDVSAFHYLIKPISEDKFTEVYKKAVSKVLSQRNHRRQMIIVPYHNGSKSITIKEVYYAESQNHKIILHTYSGTIEYYAKMEDLENKLKNSFFRIHRGYLINLEHVEEYNKSEVTLSNGESLLISKYKYTEFVKAYLRFIKNEDEGI